MAQLSACAAKLRAIPRHHPMPGTDAPDFPSQLQAALTQLSHILAQSTMAAKPPQLPAQPAANSHSNNNKIVHMIIDDDDLPPLESVRPTMTAPAPVMNTTTTSTVSTGIPRPNLNVAPSLFAGTGLNVTANLFGGPTTATPTIAKPNGITHDLQFDQHVGFTNKDLAKESIISPRPSVMIPSASTPTDTSTKSYASTIAASVSTSPTTAVIQPSLTTRTQSPTAAAASAPLPRQNGPSMQPPMQRQTSANDSKGNYQIIMEIKCHLCIRQSSMLTPSKREALLNHLKQFVTSIRKITEEREQVTDEVLHNIVHPCLRTHLFCSSKFLDNCVTWFKQYIRKGDTKLFGKLVEFLEESPNIEVLFHNQPPREQLDPYRTFLSLDHREATILAFGKLRLLFDDTNNQIPVQWVNIRRKVNSLLSKWEGYDALDASAWWEDCLAGLSTSEKKGGEDEKDEEEVGIQQFARLQQNTIDERQTRHKKATIAPTLIIDLEKDENSNHASSASSSSNQLCRQCRRPVVPGVTFAPMIDETVTFYSNDVPSAIGLKSILKRRDNTDETILVSPRHQRQAAAPSPLTFPSPIPAPLADLSSSDFLHEIASFQQFTRPPLTPEVTRVILDGRIPKWSLLIQPKRSLRDSMNAIFEQILALLLHANRPDLTHQWMGLFFQWNRIDTIVGEIRELNPQRDAIVDAFLTPLQDRSWTDPIVRDRDWSMERIMVGLIDASPPTPTPAAVTAASSNSAFTEPASKRPRYNDNVPLSPASSTSSGSSSQRDSRGVNRHAGGSNGHVVTGASNFSPQTQYRSNLPPPYHHAPSTSYGTNGGGVVAPSSYPYQQPYQRPPQKSSGASSPARGASMETDSIDSTTITSLSDPPEPQRSLSPQPQFDPDMTPTPPAYPFRPPAIHKDFSCCKKYNETGSCDLLSPDVPFDSTQLTSSKTQRKVCEKSHRCWDKNCDTRFSQPHPARYCPRQTSTVEKRPINKRKA